ncbi:MAG: hydrolase [Clostridia bacterium]|nr:hydrolase [Clostridia bacterium]MBQ6897709.1 hydrolase [Clostridia bacterium]
MNNETNKSKAPVFESRLRHNILRVPEEAYACSGISIFGRCLKTFIFSTDIAIIRNCDADAVFAVYPFTPQIAISESIIKNSYIPVFCGVGGGTTQGARTVSLAKDVEAQGAMGVVLNAPVSDENVRKVADSVDIPVIITVVSEETDISERLDAGAAILNVAAADKTSDLVKKIREKYPEVPIIATGGPTGDTIRKTVEAGANAITYTPPSTKELFSLLMKKYR